MPMSPASTLPNSSPVARRSVGFCRGVRTRCSPSAAEPARGGPRTSASAHPPRRGRATLGGGCSRGAAPRGGRRGGEGAGCHAGSKEPRGRRLGRGRPIGRTALCLAGRLLPDRAAPAEGDVLDREGQMPQTYAAERAPTAFERELWARFWELANDPEEARKRGVRALHGEAVSTRLRKDRIYTITLRSTGELTIQPTR